MQVCDKMDPGTYKTICKATLLLGELAALLPALIFWVFMTGRVYAAPVQ